MSTRRRTALLTLLLLAVLTVGMGLWLRSAQRQYALNRRLIAALVKGDDRKALDLVNEGADPNTHYVPMLVPSLPELVKQLLYRCAPPINDSPTALLIACGALWNDEVVTAEAQAHRPDDPQLVQVMLRHGAEVNVKDHNGSTPLLWAISSDRSKTTSILVTSGADVNASNDGGHLPLLQAVQWRTSLDTVRLLIEHGADVNARDKYGQTPLMRAGVNEVCPSAVPLLLDHGADVNARDNKGQTALYEAIQEATPPSQDVRIRIKIRQLLSHGANPNLGAKDGRTPLQVVRANHDADVVRLLRHYGAKR